MLLVHVTFLPVNKQKAKVISQVLQNNSTCEKIQEYDCTLLYSTSPGSAVAPRQFWPWASSETHSISKSRLASFGLLRAPVFWTRCVRIPYKPSSVQPSPNHPDLKKQMVMEKMWVGIPFGQRERSLVLVKSVTYRWTCLNTAGSFWSNCRKLPFHKVYNGVYDSHIGWK